MQQPLIRYARGASCSSLNRQLRLEDSQILQFVICKSPQNDPFGLEQLQDHLGTLVQGYIMKTLRCEFPLFFSYQLLLTESLG